MSEEEESGSTTTVSEELANSQTFDPSATGPSIDFNLYRLEMTYNQLEANETGSRFDPVGPFGRMEGNTFRLAEAYKAYRLVWMDEQKK